LQFHQDEDDVVELAESMLIKYFKRSDLVQDEAADAPEYYDI
jgi:hypothetical protein